MKEVTEIKVGQVWVIKGGCDEPVMITKIGDFAEYRWFIDDEECFESRTALDFAKRFEFVTDCMSEEDFKEWCKTGKNPTLKSVTQTKDDEIIYQSQPIGQKHDSNKPRFSLLPSQIWQVIDVLEFGSKKYGVDNWKQVDNAKERYFNACHRHLHAWWSGERLDAESGLPHLAHAVCCLLFLMWGDDAKSTDLD